MGGDAQSFSNTKDVQSYISPICIAGYTEPYVPPSFAAGYEIPNPVNKVYADPGNKKETIFNWFEANRICKINPSDIK